MAVSHVYTVAFQGIEAREVDVQVHIADGGGNGFFNVVGLGDKAVGESRERVRAALSAIGLSMPLTRVTVNLAPADLPNAGCSAGSEPRPGARSTTTRGSAAASATAASACATGSAGSPAITTVAASSNKSAAASRVGIAAS